MLRRAWKRTVQALVGGVRADVAYIVGSVVDPTPRACCLGCQPRSMRIGVSYWTPVESPDRAARGAVGGSVGLLRRLWDAPLGRRSLGRCGPLREAREGPARAVGSGPPGRHRGWPRGDGRPG